MKAARQRKNRKCRECGVTKYATAQGMLEHVKEHRTIERLRGSGIVVPPSGIIVVKN